MIERYDVSIESCGVLIEGCVDTKLSETRVKVKSFCGYKRRLMWWLEVKVLSDIIAPAMPHSTRWYCTIGTIAQMVFEGKTVGHALQLARGSIAQVPMPEHCLSATAMP
jgi:hypothetical protein